MRGLGALSFIATLCIPASATPAFQLTVSSNETAGTATFVCTQTKGKWMGMAVGGGMGDADDAYVCANENDVDYKFKRIPLSENLKVQGPGTWSSYTDVPADEGSCQVKGENVVMTFTRPIAGGNGRRKLNTGGKDTTIIWAEGTGKFQRHSNRGISTVDIENGASKVISEYSTLLILHMVIMGTAWVLLAPMGIICARYFKSQNPLWFHLHRVLVLLAVVCTIVGVAIGFTQGSHTSNHYKIGIAISASLLFQPVLGLVRPDKDSGNRKMWYIAHAVFGVVLIAISIAQVQQGISLLDNKASTKAIPVVVSLYGVQLIFVLISEGGLQGLYGLPWIQNDPSPPGPVN